MRKIVLTFGLVSGIALSAMLLATLPFHDRMSPETAMIVGYTTMVAAFLLVYFGVRRYRDTIGGGTVSFGRACAVGALIAAVSSACYVATWQVVFFGFQQDYLTNYQAKALERDRARGVPEAELEKQRIEYARWAELYRNPAINAAITFAEPLPVALLAVLVSATALSRRRKVAPQAAWTAGAPVT